MARIVEADDARSRGANMNAWRAGRRPDPARDRVPACRLWGAAAPDGPLPATTLIGR